MQITRGNVFIHRPMIVRAERWCGRNVEEMVDFLGARLRCAVVPDQAFRFASDDGREHTAFVGDWIVHEGPGLFCVYDQFKFTRYFEEVK